MRKYRRWTRYFLFLFPVADFYGFLWSSNCSVLEIQLETDVRIPIRYIWSALPDGYCHGRYDVGKTYRMCGSAWRDTLVKLCIPRNIIELEATAS